MTAIATGPTAEVTAVTASADGIVAWSLAWRRPGLARGALALPAGVGRPEQLAVAPDGARASLVVGTDGSAIVNLETGTSEARRSGWDGSRCCRPLRALRRRRRGAAHGVDLESGVPDVRGAAAGQCDGVERRMRNTVQSSTAGQSLTRGIPSHTAKSSWSTKRTPRPWRSPPTAPR